MNQEVNGRRSGMRETQDLRTWRSITKRRKEYTPPLTQHKWKNGRVCTKINVSPGRYNQVEEILRECPTKKNRNLDRAEHCWADRGGVVCQRYLLMWSEGHDFTVFFCRDCIQVTVSLTNATTSYCPRLQHPHQHHSDMTSVRTGVNVIMKTSTKSLGNESKPTLLWDPHRVGMH